LPIKEYPQTQANCTAMGQSLYDALVGRNLVLYADNELRQHALSTVGVEGVHGWRIAKEKASKKIDVIIALSLACVSAMEHRGEIGSRSARGFNRAVHVAKDTIEPFRDSIFVGQTV
jgi:hypothetical protein